VEQWFEAMLREVSQWVGGELPSQGIVVESLKWNRSKLRFTKAWHPANGVAVFGLLTQTINLVHIELQVAKHLKGSGVYDVSRWSSLDVGSLFGDDDTVAKLAKQQCHGEANWSSTNDHDVAGA